MNFELDDRDVDPDKALIYMWEIYALDGTVVGRYVGKAKNGSKRPIKHYRRNVDRLLSGKPYRKSNPEGFRKVHRALAHAVTSGYGIKLFFLTNVAHDQNINDVESSLITVNNSKGDRDWQLNG